MTNKYSDLIELLIKKTESTVDIKAFTESLKDIKLLVDKLGLSQEDIKFFLENDGDKSAAKFADKLNAIKDDNDKKAVGDAIDRLNTKNEKGKTPLEIAKGILLDRDKLKGIGQLEDKDLEPFADILPKAEAKDKTDGKADAKGKTDKKDKADEKDDDTPIMTGDDVVGYLKKGARWTMNNPLMIVSALALAFGVSNASKPGGTFWGLAWVTVGLFALSALTNGGTTWGQSASVADKGDDHHSHQHAEYAKAGFHPHNPTLVQPVRGYEKDGLGYGS